MADKKKYNSDKSFVADAERANEPAAAYDTMDKRQKNSAEKDYLSSEEFWKKVEEKRKNFCLKNGIV